MYIRPLKEEKYLVRITVGGDKLDFCGDASSVAAFLATVKLILDSVVSTKGEKFTTADIKDFLCLFFSRHRIHEYEIEDNSSRNHQPISTPRSGRRWLGLHEDCKGMPGLKQTARLANERLVHHLAPYGYAIQHILKIGCAVSA